MKLTVQKRGDNDYIAFDSEATNKIWGCGTTAKEAIGDYICYHNFSIGIPITWIGVTTDEVRGE